MSFSSIFSTLQFYMGFPFVRYALIVGVLIALCSSLFGVTLVLKRYSFIGDGLSHVAFGAMAVATIFNLVSDTVIIMPVTVVAAILLLRTGQNTKIKGDAAIAKTGINKLIVTLHSLFIHRAVRGISHKIPLVLRETPCALLCRPVGAPVRTPRGMVLQIARREDNLFTLRIDGKQP